MERMPTSLKMQRDLTYLKDTDGHPLMSGAGVHDLRNSRYGA